MNIIKEEKDLEYLNVRIEEFFVGISILHK
jgi:hypothetical protein